MELGATAGPVGLPVMGIREPATQGVTLFQERPRVGVAFPALTPTPSTASAPTVTEGTTQLQPGASPILSQNLLSTYLLRVAHFYPKVIRYTPVFKEEKSDLFFP